MYINFKSAISMNLCEEIIELSKIKTFDDVKSKELHFSRKGRYAFENAENGRDLLKRILKSLKENTTLLDYYETPVVHHTFLLIKMPHGVPTRLHQDRPYWIEIKDEPASMLTAWFALEYIDSNNGCLRLNKTSMVDTVDLLNTNPIHFDHMDDEYTKEQAALTITPNLQQRILNQFDDINCAPGDLVVFDAFEPHCAAGNNTNSPRMAFKIVFGEKNKLGTYYDEVKSFIN